MNENKAETLARIKRITNFLDTAFTVPGTKLRIGTDALIGLIPGIGDIAALIPALYIAFEGARLGVPQRVFFIMIMNVALDTLIGSIPVLGDVFDFFWKANVRNLRLIEKYV